MRAKLLKTHDLILSLSKDEAKISRHALAKISSSELFLTPVLARSTNICLHKWPMTSLGYSSKLNAERAFLTMLKEEGRRTADEFLKCHGNGLGQRSTVNLDALLQQV
jgi:hypothetical protein